MRSAILLVLPLALAACATPRESCLSSVGRQGRVIDALIAETRGNIARGYGIEEREELRTRRGVCEYRDENGTLRQRFCDRTVSQEVRVPVTLDIEAEKVKLDQLLQRREALTRAEGPARAQCAALYPA
ncbi:hypothetical protein ACR03S_01905 [Limimaricola variabilis]|uniref:hypothetical protein n=1 Tax=Limimaricola variabilis TaxID=1492771 RepID=UPI002AC958EA|nr:hypothetical protein [Limimaricola variabilis]WPY94102.1 hypothetical protein T8T21_13475 [Limimaricola variabilis]